METCKRSKQNSSLRVSRRGAREPPHTHTPHPTRSFWLSPFGVLYRAQSRRKLQPASRPLGAPPLPVLGPREWREAVAGDRREPSGLGRRNRSRASRLLWLKAEPGRVNEAQLGGGRARSPTEIEVQLQVPPPRRRRRSSWIGGALDKAHWAVVPKRPRIGAQG